MVGYIFVYPTIAVLRPTVRARWKSVGSEKQYYAYCERLIVSTRIIVQTDVNSQRYVVAVLAAYEKSGMQGRV